MPSKALIAGAGIAGLAAGIALRNAGLDVEILERAPDMREIGAGLSITPNGADALRQLGVEVKVHEVRRLSEMETRWKAISSSEPMACVQRCGVTC